VYPPALIAGRFFIILFLTNEKYLLSSVSSIPQTLFGGSKMLRKATISPREMCNLYEQGHSAGLIAKKAGVTPYGVRYHLHRQGVKMRPKGKGGLKVPRTLAAKTTKAAKPKSASQQTKKTRISVKDLKYMYTVQEKNLRQIGQETGISGWTVRNRLVKAGVRMRPRGNLAGNRPVMKIALAKKYQPAILTLVSALGGRQV
jgi:DNA-binding CsgD family transcriptional regulator